ncbi:MAG TPA: hypothetical protein VFG35_15440 [Actinoplanes sp.]|nr:hypothetical protein [Actinoplanes sp.]
MKLKFKMGKKQIAVLVVLGLAVLALLVHRSRDVEQAKALDSAAVTACNDVAAKAGSARSETARLALADKVTASAAKSDNNAVRDRALELGRNADEGNAAWRSSVNALTQACEDAGWTAP